MKRKTFTELKTQALNSLHLNYGPLILGWVISLAISFIVSTAFDSVSTSTSMSSTITYQIAQLIITILMSLFNVSFLMMCLKVLKGEKNVATDIFYAFRNTPDRYIGSYIIYLIFTMLPVIPGEILIMHGAGSEFIEAAEQLAYETTDIYSTAATLPLHSATEVMWGFVLIIVGGIVSIYFSLCFAAVNYLLLEDKGLKVVDAFKASRAMMKGNKFRLLLLYISFVGWFILSIFTLGLLTLWITPYMTTTLALFYMDIQGIAPSGKENEDHTFDATV
ncbi:MAG: DUF975 family protein [Eubacterium sp.]|nr:DUF975 family protein [Eubacterium sp.]